MTISKDEQKLIYLYRKMYDHTKLKCHPPRCKSYYTPMRCCSPEYCESTVQYAKDIWGVDLKITGHKDLPLMGPEGCTAEPHLRSICTVHDCLINSLGCDPGDDEWTARYFQLRQEINELEHDLFFNKE